MTLKSKILAAGLTVIIAGGGIFMANINTAQAQTDNNNSSPTIAQLQQMVETLKQQIQQIIALIAQLKPQETCGNGACRFGETAASCPSDCQAVDNCIQEGKWGQQNQKCCQGLTASYRPAVSSGNIDAQGLFICYKCGDGICSENELQEYCPKDCSEVVTDNGKAKCIATGGAWIDSDCAGCIPQTRAERNAGSMVCAKICVHDKICQCGNGKYWGSREEGCLTNAACVKEGERIYTNDAKKCCGGLVAYSPCTSEQDCIADFWTCLPPGAPVPSSQTACSTNNDCISDGGTCHKCFNKSWWNSQTSSTKLKWACLGIGDSICQCKNKVCTSVSVCGDGVCNATYENKDNCAKDCPSQTGSTPVNPVQQQLQSIQQQINNITNSVGTLGNGSSVTVGTGGTTGNTSYVSANPSQTACSTNNDCISDGGTCHKCFNKSWWNSQTSSTKLKWACDGIGDSICQCKNKVCTSVSVCGDGVCNATYENKDNCAKDCPLGG